MDRALDSDRRGGSSSYEVLALSHRCMVFECLAIDFGKDVMCNLDVFTKNRGGTKNANLTSIWRPPHPKLRLKELIGIEMEI